MSSIIDQLNDLNELKMFYRGDIYDQISGKNPESLSLDEKQKYFFEKIFFDTDKCYTFNTINDALEQELDNDVSEDLTTLASLFGKEEDTSEKEKKKLLSLSSYSIGNVEENAAFGSTKLEDPESLGYEEDGNYVESLITESNKLQEGKDLVFIHVENDILHTTEMSTDDTEVFLNYIPAIERSRCVPYFSVEVFSRNNLSRAERVLVNEMDSLENISILKFVSGEDFINKESFTTADGNFVQSSTNINPGDATKNPFSTVRDGMEMFTMPQTFMSKKKDSNIDPFRPFMSLKSATINTQSAGQGILSYNTATLVVELYDRHRLEDVAYFLDPGKFGYTSFEITAGWSHQDPSSPYGKLLNRMKTKEMYQLITSKFTFNEAGVVTITMELAMKGKRSAIERSIFEGDNSGGSSVNEAYKKLEETLITVRTGVSSINSTRSTSNILPSVIITDLENKSHISYNEDDLETVLNTLNSISNTTMSAEERQKLKAALTEIKNGAISNYYTALENYTDQFLNDIGLSTENETDFIYFDKLIANAVSKRFLIDKESTIDEAHVFIYRFGQKAPGVQNKLISTFKLNKSKISKKLKEIIQDKRNLSLLDFIVAANSLMKDRLDSQFNIVSVGDLEKINNIDGEIKRLETKKAELEKSKTDKEETKSNETSDERIAQLDDEIDTINEDIQEVNDAISTLTRGRTNVIDNGLEDLKSTQRTSSIYMPDLSVKMEVKKSESKEDSRDRKKIIRIVIYDNNRKPNELQTFLANLNKTVSLNIPNPDDSDSFEKSRVQTLYNDLIQEGIVESITVKNGETESTKIKTNLRSKHFKQAQKESMSSITYATEGTAINKISISGISDANMEAHFLLKSQSDTGANIDNTGEDESDDDAQKLMPVNISITTMGCPVVRYGQEYFVDLGTNTDIDNVYTATKITHNISQGVFTSQIELKPNYRSEVSFGNLISDIQFIVDTAE